jgi:tetratricopeptide (TPR) repeat protein
MIVKRLRKLGFYVKKKAGSPQLFSLTPNGATLPIWILKTNDIGGTTGKGSDHGKSTQCRSVHCQQKSFIASNPDCGTSHYNLGVALLGQGKIEEAEEALATAIECSPGLAEAYVQMGGICLKRGDMDGCLDWNQRAVKAKPGFSEGWGNIGFVLLQRGDIEGAIKALEKATSFNFRFIQALPPWPTPT